MFLLIIHLLPLFFFFFFNDTATTEIYTLSLHDALPIYGDEPQTLAVARGEVAAPLLAGGRESLQLRARQAAGAGEGSGQLLLAHRFQQVSDGMRIESLDRVTVIGGGGGHRRRPFPHL